MIKYISPLIMTASLGFLSGCASTPEPEAKTVNVDTSNLDPSCVSVNLLTRKVIPAVTKSGTAITSIENPPEYIYNPETGKTDVYQAPPIERKENWTKIIKPEEIIYVDAEGNQVTNVCELKAENSGADIVNPDGTALPPPPVQ